MKSEILLIGNELLIGKVHDTNGTWTIDQLLPLGMEISQITIIQDSIPRIHASITEALARSPRFLFTSGGLGPTFDDMTLKGITGALSPPQKIVEHPQAVDMIYNSYARRFEKSEAEVKGYLEKRYPLYRKMAQLPACAIPLFNSEGAAPGVLIPSEFTNGETEIIALPGIPREYQAIFLEHVIPRVSDLGLSGVFHQAGFIFLNLGESRFTELVYSLKDDYPEIWIKTHPRMRIIDGKRQYEVELHLTSFVDSPSILPQMHELYTKLHEHVVKSGGQILVETPVEISSHPSNEL
ncbi:MAG: competence/damage-inducible protein A [Promethearchaeota archaeon]